MNGHQNEAFSCLIGALNSPRKVNGYGADYAVDLEDFEENPGSYKDEIDEIECDIFNRWFDDYLSTLSQDESLDFYCDLVREGILVGRVNYTVKIPFAIIKKARE